MRENEVLYFYFQFQSFCHYWFLSCIQVNLLTCPLMDFCEWGRYLDLLRSGQQKRLILVTFMEKRSCEINYTKMQREESSRNFCKHTITFLSCQSAACRLDCRHLFEVLMALFGPNSVPNSLALMMGKRSCRLSSFFRLHLRGTFLSPPNQHHRAVCHYPSFFEGGGLGLSLSSFYMFMFCLTIRCLTLLINLWEGSAFYLCAKHLIN